jgi:hypothetical protein
LWQEDAAQRGILFGREGAWSKDGKAKPKQRAPITHFLATREKAIFLHTTFRDFEEDYRTDEDEDEEMNIPEAERPPLALAYFGARPSNEAYLFDYFISAICPNCSLSPIDNPYLRYVAPMTLVYPPLQHAVLAIAATERQHQNDRRFAREAWHYKTLALKGLQESIASGSVSWPFVATVLMLTFGDIADGCSDSWTTHLRGGLTVLNSIRAECTESQMLRKFCLMYFVAHDIMGSTAVSASSESAAYTWLEDDNLDEIDPLMGCSRALLDIIRQISVIFAEASRTQSLRALTDEEVEQLSIARANFERMLHRIDQHPPSTSVNPNIALVAKAKRTTALLYLHSRYSAIIPLATNLQAPKDAAPHCISRLVKLLIAQLEPLPVTPTLLWPLFVLANASPVHEGHRRFVLERLNGMLEGRNLGSVRLARRLVERRFRNHDLGKCVEVETIGGLKGKRISLA